MKKPPLRALFNVQLPLRAVRAPAVKGAAPFVSRALSQGGVRQLTFHVVFFPSPI